MMETNKTFFLGMPEKDLGKTGTQDMIQFEKEKGNVKNHAAFPRSLHFSNVPWHVYLQVRAQRANCRCGGSVRQGCE
jgi:hypothetical protein